MVQANIVLYSSWRKSLELRTLCTWLGPDGVEIESAATPVTFPRRDQLKSSPDPV